MVESWRDTGLAEEWVSVTSLANELGVRRQSVHKVIKRLNLTTSQRRVAGSRGQLASTVSPSDAALVRDELGRNRRADHPSPSSPESECSFYIIQLVPELDPRRIKLGVADSVEERLRNHRTASPTARVLKTWACKRSWESAAIDALVSRDGTCRRLSNEVFDCEDVDGLTARGDSFFEMMPDPAQAIPVSPYLRSARTEKEPAPVDAHQD